MTTTNQKTMLVRLTKDQHEQVTARAKAAGLSVNAYAVKAMLCESPALTPDEAIRGAEAALERALAALRSPAPVQTETAQEVTETPVEAPVEVVVEPVVEALKGFPKENFGRYIRQVYQLEFDPSTKVFAYCYLQRRTGDLVYPGDIVQVSDYDWRHVQADGSFNRYEKIGEIPEYAALVERLDAPRRAEAVAKMAVLMAAHNAPPEAWVEAWALPARAKFTAEDIPFGVFPPSGDGVEWAKVVDSVDVRMAEKGGYAIAGKFIKGDLGAAPAGSVVAAKSGGLLAIGIICADGKVAWDSAPAHPPTSPFALKRLQDVRARAPKAGPGAALAAPVEEFDLDSITA